MLSLLVRLPLCLALVFGAYWTVRFALADRYYRMDQYTRAAELVPFRALYVAGAGDLGRAVEMNPYLSEERIELGLSAEMRGDYAAAERHLLTAARYARTFTPLWTLANYYFRRNNPSELFRWGRRAATIGSTNRFDLNPLFDLYWQASNDPQEILVKGVPEAPEPLRRYLSFLIGQTRMEPARVVADKIMAQAGEPDLPVLYAYAERLINQGEAPTNLWNQLCSRRLIPHAPLDPAAGRSLANQDFAIPAINRFFDWRLLDSPAVSVRQGKEMVRVSFSGKQPETCEALVQFVPVLPGRTYRIAAQADTTGLSSTAGLRWRAWNVRTNKEIEMKGGLEHAVFTPDHSLVRLSLFYQRALGTMRVEGSMTVRGVTLRIL